MSARIRGKIKLNGMQAFAAHSLLLQSRDIGTKALSNTIETYFQIFSTKYGKFQPNIQIFEYSILCLVSHINHCLDTNKPKRDLTRANGSYSDVHDVKKIC